MSRAAAVWLTAALAASVAAAQAPGGGPRTVRERGPSGQRWLVGSQSDPTRTIPIKPGEECPPGTTLVRVGQCQAPEWPAPSILDYRPKSTLVVDEHPVPRAKFPVVDIHSHTGPTPQSIDRLIREMDALNIRILNNLSGGSG